MIFLNVVSPPAPLDGCSLEPLLQPAQSENLFCLPPEPEGF